MNASTAAFSEKTDSLKKWLNESDAVMIGAGAGMSTAAGFTYSGERFERYFSDFEAKYGFHDMYSGGFHPFKTPEERWAYWSRYIWINRYMDAPGSIYTDLFAAVRGRDYFVLTTNVDHCFQKAGFAKERLFYTQGDYGLWQCSEPCGRETYDNREAVRQMLLAQGFAFDAADNLIPAEHPLMVIPSSMVPSCPLCGKPMSMNLRADDTFVQDAGWDAACDRYQQFVEAHCNQKVLYLEIGVGYNTPGIIKYNFQRQTWKNPSAHYVCLNAEEQGIAREIRDRSLCIAGDSAKVIGELGK